MQVAIVIPVLNQVAYTQQCIAGLAPDIERGVRVIVIDNGSTDRTPQWLQGRRELVVIRNDENRGCAPAWNQGVAAAGESDWIVILNNDVLLPRGWLEALLGSADAHGLDVVCPAMRERDLNYDFQAYSRDFMERLKNVIRPSAAHGVAFAVRRLVFEKVGNFDEAFRIGQFEDADFFRRVRGAGFAIGITGACFIHHFGSVTQDALSDETGNRPYEAENRAHFREKWNLTWARRRREKFALGLRAWWWRTSERIRFGHSLHEKWDGERVRYY